jgi:hypothetical protein
LGASGRVGGEALARLATARNSERGEEKRD